MGPFLMCPQIDRFRKFGLAVTAGEPLRAARWGKISVIANYRRNLAFDFGKVQVILPGVHARDVLLELVVPVERHGAPLRLLEGAADPRGFVVGLGVPRQFVPPVEAVAADPARKRQLARVDLQVVPGSANMNFCIA